MLNLQKAEFVKSAAAPAGFIKEGPQIVFSGKSNVGKSSVINKLLNRKNFARVGASPGKTVHINYFRIDGRLLFVDLPGYGYAKVSQAERARWAALMESYFASPGHIGLAVLIVDARHKPTADDVQMADWYKWSGGRYLVLANKVDKVKRSELEANLLRIRETLGLPDEVTVLPFSAEKGTGREALLAVIEKLADIS